MTAADVVFSFRRLINLKGNPAFLLGGVTVSSRGTHTVILRSKTPNTAIPAIVANTSLGIVNSKLARENGATDKPGADKTDKAERSGSTRRRRRAPAAGRTCSRSTARRRRSSSSRTRATGAGSRRSSASSIRNMVAATQFINVQRGRHEVAIDLSAQQADSLRRTTARAR